MFLEWSIMGIVGAGALMLLHLFLSQTPTEPAARRSRKSPRLSFRMMVVLSLPLILSIALNLFPLFPQSQQWALAQCHRYSALGFVLAAWSFSYWRWRTEWRNTASLDKSTRKENACHS